MPTYLELAYEANFVCRCATCDVFTYKGQLWLGYAPTNHVVPCHDMIEKVFGY